LRGGFGYAFKRVVCAIRNKECPDCILKERCVYSYVFETPPPSDTKIMRKYKTVPHPFVIEPPSEKKRGYKPGDEMNFGLTLIGRAIDCLSYFIYTFDELGKIGVGKGKSKYELKSVSCDGKTIYDSGTKTLISFESASLNVGIPTLVKGGEGGFSDQQLSWLRDKDMVVFSLYDEKTPFFLLDVFIEDQFDFQSIYQRRHEIRLGDIAIPLTPIDVLIKMKEKTGRPQDRADVFYLKKIMEEWKDG